MTPPSFIKYGVLMEVPFLLMLLVGIVIVLCIAFYLSSKQNRNLKKKLIKLEPQIDPGSVSISHIKTENVIEEISDRGDSLHITEHWHDQSNDNLLLAENTESHSDVTNRNILGDEKVSFDDDNPKESLRLQQKPVLNRDIIYFMVVAPADRPHSGYELLQSLLSAGLRYGPMNIFHRFEDANGRGKILFSVASIEEPGTFEISRMGAYTGKGLMMFLRFSPGKDLSAAFEIMLETAKQLIEDLGGQILDDEKQVICQEKIEKWRKKIIDYEQKQLIPDLFDI